MPIFDWNDIHLRKEYEHSLDKHRQIKRNWPWPKKIQWFCGVIGLQFLTVLFLYTPVAYYMVKNANDEKEEKEKIMKEAWLMKNKNGTVEGAMPTFEYYEFGNHLICNYYYFMTAFCQGFGYLSCVMFHFMNYKWWNILGTITAVLCLPVDIWIFYYEPLGQVGTLIVMVLGFTPFGITIADAAYPEKVKFISDKNGGTMKCYKNSWTKHFSLSSNERYNFVARQTWAGYSLFATIALAMSLLQGNLLIILLVLYSMPCM